MGKLAFKQSLVNIDIRNHHVMYLLSLLKTYLNIAEGKEILACCVYFKKL